MEPPAPSSLTSPPSGRARTRAAAGSVCTPRSAGEDFGGSGLLTGTSPRGGTHRRHGDNAWRSLWEAEVGLRAGEALARESRADALALETQIVREAVALEVQALHEVIRRRTHGEADD